MLWVYEGNSMIEKKIARLQSRADQLVGAVQKVLALAADDTAALEARASAMQELDAAHVKLDRASCTALGLRGRALGQGMIEYQATR